MSIVLDASMALAWCLDGPWDDGIAAVLRETAEDGALVTPLWHLEVCNAFLMAERRGRITRSQATQALAKLDGLPLEQLELDPDPSDLMQLARSHGLTAYDASYVWAASVTGCPLATRDERVRAAAVAEGIALLG